jgi:hypothetical protein
VNYVKALLAILAALLVIGHPWAILAAELVVLAVIAAGISRSAGFSLASLPSLRWRNP